jgi:hypothetical protein
LLLERGQLDISGEYLCKTQKTITFTVLSLFDNRHLGGCFPLSPNIVNLGVDKASSDVFLWLPQLFCLQTYSRQTFVSILADQQFAGQSSRKDTSLSQIAAMWRVTLGSTNFMHHVPWRLFP